MTYSVSYMCVACLSLRMVDSAKNMCYCYYQLSVTSEGAYRDYLIVKDGRLLSIVNELNMTNG
jgi:hypothetical protein